jgi:hypothetical protein
MTRTEVGEMVAPARRAAFHARVRAKLSSGQLPFVEQLLEARYQLRRGRYADRLPWLPADRFDVVRELHRHGVTQRPVQLPDAVEHAADRMVDHLRNVDTAMARVRVPVTAHEADPSVFKWGLAAENLDLAEGYIGLPVRYLGVEVKRERAGGSDVEMIRRWHMDIEDHRMLKIIIYLNDVDDDGGPFEYLDRERTVAVIRALNYRDRYQLGYAIDQVVPDRTGRRLTGARLTAVYADTCRILHRATAPTAEDRYSLTFQYSSMTPRHAFPHCMLGADALWRLGDELTTRQRRALLID